MEIPFDQAKNMCMNFAKRQEGTTKEGLENLGKVLDIIFGVMEKDGNTITSAKLSGTRHNID